MICSCLTEFWFIYRHPSSLLKWTCSSLKKKRAIITRHTVSVAFQVALLFSSGTCVSSCLTSKKQKSIFKLFLSCIKLDSGQCADGFNISVTIANMWVSGSVCKGKKCVSCSPHLVFVLLLFCEAVYLTRHSSTCCLFHTWGAAFITTSTISS